MKKFKITKAEYIETIKDDKNNFSYDIWRIFFDGYSLSGEYAQKASKLTKWAASQGLLTSKMRVATEAHADLTAPEDLLVLVEVGKDGSIQGIKTITHPLRDGGFVLFLDSSELE